MADKTQNQPKPSDPNAERVADNSQDDNTARNDAHVVTSPSADVQVAEKAGITEGEVKALRDDAGLNQLAGQGANVHAWELSDAGKEYLDGEDDRQKANEDEAKKYEDEHKDGLTKAEARYFEATGNTPDKG